MRKLTAQLLETLFEVTTSSVNSEVDPVVSKWYVIAERWHVIDESVVQLLWVFY